MSEFVALVQQGEILDQRVVAQGDDEQALREQAVKVASALNANGGESLAFTVAVLRLDAAD